MTRSALVSFVVVTLAFGVPKAPASLPNANADTGGRIARQAAADLPAGIPGEWWAKVQRDIRESEYHINWQDPTPDGSAGPAQAGVYQAPNRAHDFRTSFTPEGIRVMPRTLEEDGGQSTRWKWGLTLTRFGEAPAAPAQLEVSGNRIEYQRGDLTEWYINDERGLEQGFSLAAPPESTRAHPQSLIELELAVSGGLSATRSADGQALEFSTPGGAPVVHYGGLLAQDATGRELPANMELKDVSLRLVVDATSATYPITIDPVTTSANWTADSDQAGAGYGWEVAGAGDVNGDGYDDVIVGAPFYDNGQTDEGRVWVYHGSASGLISFAAFRAEGNQANAYYGASVATAGDVNGDGYDDVIVGAVAYDNGQTDEGQVWVYHGSASGLIAPAAFIADSDQANAHYGENGSVATAGDVNGDGYDDIIVGAPQYDNPEPAEGQVWVYHGSASGLMSFAAFRADSDQAYAEYGGAVGTAGDVNGDGFDDVIVGAFSYDNGQTDEGQVWVYHGSHTGLIAPAAFKADSDQANAIYGASVATAGDVNGDGYDDVIVGAPFYDNGQTGEGRVWVYHGSASGLISFAAFRAEGNQAYAEYGWAVGTAGDVNGDGYDDVIVGASNYDNPEPAEGQVWLYHGSASGLIWFAAFSEGGNQGYAKYGYSVATAGDVNADGYDDVIVGAPYYDNGQTDEGRVFVYHGPL